MRGPTKGERAATLVPRFYLLQEVIMNKCISCDEPIVPHTGHDRRRVHCSQCLPDGLTHAGKSRLSKNLRTRQAQEDKEKQGCTACGYNRCGAALDWHHPNKDKELNPGQALARSWAMYQEEISRCVLLCANCHREHHHYNK